MQNTRNTMQRDIVLNAVLESCTHPTADNIYHEVHEAHPHISRATVYRNLSVLSGEGKIQKITHTGTADRYDFNLSHHYHFRCTACDKVFDIDLPYDEGILGRVPNKAGFRLSGCEVMFTGLCPACVAAEAAPGAETAGSNKAYSQQNDIFGGTETWQN